MEPSGARGPADAEGHRESARSTTADDRPPGTQDAADADAPDAPEPPDQPDQPELGDGFEPL